MAPTRNHRNYSQMTKERQESQAMAEPAEKAKELTNDLVDYLTDYARENPGYAALCCLGIGFVLGWKLKPW